MKTGGAIVMTGSVTGFSGTSTCLDYSMTKGGIHAFTRSLASNLVGPRHSGQCRGAGPGVDAAQSGRQAGGARASIRQRYADETAGTARGDRAGFRVSGGAQLLELHHRRDAADYRRVPAVRGG